MVYLYNGIAHIFIIGYVILVNSMLSDTIDEHERDTGLRKEGLFFAARAFATKTSCGLGSLFAGVGLDIISFPKQAGPENVPEAAVTSFAVLGGPVCLALFLAAIMISRLYPLNAERHRQIIADIEARAPA